ncbi:hypothetical protein BJV82DRAFT_600846, partial [Fennellomyces sp. T-0311]
MKDVGSLSQPKLKSFVHHFILLHYVQCFDLWRWFGDVVDNVACNQAYCSFQLVSVADEPLETLAPEFRYVLGRVSQMFLNILNRLAGEITPHGVVQCTVTNSVWLVQSLVRIGISLTNPEKCKGLADVVVDIQSGGKLLSNAQSCKLVHVHPESLVEK